MSELAASGPVRRRVEKPTSGTSDVRVRPSPASMA